MQNNCHSVTEMVSSAGGASEPHEGAELRAHRRQWPVPQVPRLPRPAPAVPTRGLPAGSLEERRDHGVIAQRSGPGFSVCIVSS